MWNLFLAYFGSVNAERMGRRTLWLASTAGMLLSYVVITGLSVRQSPRPTKIPKLRVSNRLHCTGCLRGRRQAFRGHRHRSHALHLLWIL